MRSQKSEVRSQKKGLRAPGGFASVAGFFCLLSSAL